MWDISRLVACYIMSFILAIGLLAGLDGAFANDFRLNFYIWISIFYWIRIIISIIYCEQHRNYIFYIFLILFAPFLSHLIMIPRYKLFFSVISFVSFFIAFLLFASQRKSALTVKKK